MRRETEVKQSEANKTEKARFSVVPHKCGVPSFAAARREKAKRHAMKWSEASQLNPCGTKRE